VLPSVLGDAASAVVLGTRPPQGRAAPRLLSVVTSTLGVFHDIIQLAGCPLRMQIDGRAFESRVLPVHFVMCERVLGRALERANRSRKGITHLVYPNTSELDRASVTRALEIASGRLSGPGPTHCGHAFASDMILNLPAQLTPADPGSDAVMVLLAVGSGFTWGACVVG
jgi:3-oxoacyl-[acyl-carrier-protein] synthase III